MHLKTLVLTSIKRKHRNYWHGKTGFKIFQNVFHLICSFIHDCDKWELNKFSHQTFVDKRKHRFFFHILCAENKCIDRHFCACDSFAMCSSKKKIYISRRMLLAQAISMNNQRNTFAVLSSILRMCTSLKDRFVNKVLYNQHTFL